MIAKNKFWQSSLISESTKGCLVVLFFALVQFNSLFAQTNSNNNASVTGQIAANINYNSSNYQTQSIQNSTWNTAGNHYAYKIKTYSNNIASAFSDAATVEVK